MCTYNYNKMRKSEKERELAALCGLNTAWIRKGNGQ